MSGKNNPRSRYGRQPFYDLLVREGRNAAWAGRHLGFDPAYAQRVAHGRTAPTEAFRTAMSWLLREPVTKLFTEDALAADYLQRKNTRAERQLEAGDAR